MGLLDDLLGQLAGGAMPAQQRTPGRTEAGAAGGGMGRILMALAPIVLAMLANRGRSDDPSAGFGRQSGAGGGLGGLGGILGQVLGGAAAGGGLGALIEQMGRAGFGDQARSWVGKGENQSLPSGALEQIFGAGGLAEIARQAGLTQEETSRGLQQLMPEVVDRMTPNGEVPREDDLLASVDDLARKLGV